MLTPFEKLTMQYDIRDAVTSYREVMLVTPVVTSGSNYNTFSDSPYDITGPQSGTDTTAYTTNRAYARIKIIQDTTLAQMHQAVPGLEVGDYLLYFRKEDKDTLQTIVDNKNAYMFVDGVTLRPQNISLNGVGQAFDVYCHAKRYAPKKRATGL